MFKLGDKVEIINICNLSPSWLYKKMVGFNGKVSMIDKITDINEIYYIIDFPVIPINDDCMTLGQLAFTENNLRLISD